MKRLAAIFTLISLIPVLAGAEERTLSQSEAMKLVVSAPRPEYPYQARQQNITGSGSVELHVVSDGSVASAKVRQSTGSEMLDRAAMVAFSHWRFRPGQPFMFSAPITFTRDGAAFR